MTQKNRTSGDADADTKSGGEPREQALLKSLVAQAAKRGETLAGLAKILGVSYERLAQWRRGDADIRTASASVHRRAGAYLGLPTVVVLVLAGVVNLEHFVWPATEALPKRLARELERLRQHPFLGPFVPAKLTDADPEVQLFVAFLFHEFSGEPAQVVPNHRWLNALHQVTVAAHVKTGQDRADEGPQEAPLF
jgi:hypothetical protein